MKIVGVTFSSPGSNMLWASDEGYEFELWTDTNKTLALTYGSIASKTTSNAGRVTVVLDDQGDLILEYMDSIDVGTHPAQVLSDLQQLLGTP